jgi:hypothetical protein
MACDISDRVVVVHPAVFIISRFDKKFVSIKKKLNGHVKSIKMFNGNTVFGIGLFYPCQIMDIDMTKNFTSFEVEYAFNATLDHPVVLTRGTITITAPTATGQATPATLIGTGFIMARTPMPELATNGLQIGKIKCRFDGKTGPTLTVAVDSL